MNQRLQAIGEQAKRIYHSWYFPPFVILAAMLFVTYLSYRTSIIDINQEQRASINHIQEDLLITIESRLAAYEQILMGGSGLLRGSEDVNEKEWHDFVSTFDITNRYPGAQTIGYAKIGDASSAESVIANMRSQGFLNYAINPTPTDQPFAAVTYTTPIRTGKLQGFDLYSEAIRKTTMERARDANRAILTPPVQPIQNTEDQSVIQMYSPEYQADKPIDSVEERRANIKGFVFASFRAHDFFSKLIPVHANDINMGFQVSFVGANGAKQSFYQTPNWDKLVQSNSILTSSQQVSGYGQSWNIDYVFSPNELTTQHRHNTPTIVAITGSIFSILLAGIILLLLKTRARVLTAQRDKAVELAKDELLSLASHQLRTPATTVKQYLGMVLQGFTGDLTETQEDLLQKAYSGNERQLRIINEMLHIAKIDSGRITLAKQSTNLNDLVTEIATEMAPDAENVGHTFIYKVPKKPIIVDIDDHMIRMAIENLISNAIKYTLSEGKIQITLRRTKTSVEIAVKDNGIGIEQKDIRKLYRVFTRLNNRLTQTVSGTGVGLYLAKHLVELHGGSIRTHSVSGKGSTFTIILPK